MKKGSVVGHQRVERKVTEKNRRTRMKNLFRTLQTVVPTLDSTGMSLNEQLEHAKFYIKAVEEKVEGMRKRKKELQMCIEGKCGNENIVEVRDGGSSLEVILISSSTIGSTNNGSSIMLADIISILKEEGAEVLSANFYKVGAITYHTIHARAYCSRVGVETGRICERLKQLN